MSQVRCEASGCDRGRIKCTGYQCHDGYYPCGDCRATGEVTCLDCRGAKYTQYSHDQYQGCHRCGGAGHGDNLGAIRLGKGTIDCPSCENGKIRCATCGRDGGHGTVTCKNCGGTGWVDPK